MKKNASTFFIFIATLIVGVLVAMNLNYDDTDTTRIVLTAKQYQEAFNTRNKLYQEIGGLRDEYENNVKKIEKYRASTATNEKVLEDIKGEVQRNEMLLGYSSVKGQGVKVTIADGSVEFTLGIDDPYLQELRTVHNYDMIQIINELKLAGAEAISINDQRILPNSEIYCSWAFISINKVKLPSPFKVTAIGDKDVLENYLNRSESYTKQLINRGINVYIEPSNEIIMPSIGGAIKTNYIKRVK